MRKALLNAVTNLTQEYIDHPHPHPGQESVQDSQPETSNGNANHNVGYMVPCSVRGVGGWSYIFRGVEYTIMLINFIWGMIVDFRRDCS